MNDSYDVNKQSLPQTPTLKDGKGFGELGPNLWFTFYGAR
jgi:hypothetical protein